MSLARGVSRATVVFLQTNWKDVERNLVDVGGAGSSREARLAHASQVLGRPVSTFSDLSQAEGDKLVLAYKQELGQEYKAPSGYQGARRRQKAKAVNQAELAKIGEMAADLWEGDWPVFLERRMFERFRIYSAESLTGGQARSMVEELLQRIAVRNIADHHQPPIPRSEIEAEKEVLRKKFFKGQESEVRSQESASSSEL